MPVTGIPPFNVPWVDKKVRICEFYDDTQCPSSECPDCFFECDDGTNG